ncbi:iron-containing alcohol dehydrogenase family protein [Halobacillus fulvus]|nr:iron-containing alcohol dehydrogenase family protein [Halobacillus fulvus]
MQNVNVKGAPSFYRCEPGILSQLPDLVNNQMFQKAGLVHGEKSWEAVRSFLPEWPFDVSFEKYKGECSLEENERLCVRFSNVDVVIGVGGGKILDLAKACGDRLNVPVILIPTLASNCAAWTPLSVFYDQEGNFLNYEIFPTNTFMVLVEPDVLLHAPVEFLRAGIGDTIAKWYEADVLTRDLPEKSIPLEIALYAAKQCRDVLLEEGDSAVESAKERTLSPAFTRAVETIILAGGVVGGFGDHYGRVSGAHSIHNGLTKIDGTHKHLHGDKVAYGILVQLVLEDRFEEIENLLPYYKKLGLPYSLEALYVKPTEANIRTIARESTKPEESIHFMGVSNPEEVYKAIHALEERAHGDKYLVPVMSFRK